MLLQYEKLEVAYDQINHDAAEAGGGCSVLIFVAANADSMAACRILSCMLRWDVISYTMWPVNGYRDIAAANEQVLKTNADVRSIIMLNCGGRVNIEKYLTNLPPKAKVYIADSHRPIHLANIHSGRDVWVLSDGMLQNDPILSDGEDLSGAEVSDSESEEEDSDEEDSEDDLESEEELDLGGGDTIDNTSDADQDGEEGGENKPKKRKRSAAFDEKMRQKERRQKIKEQLAQRRHRLREYYQGESFGPAVAMMWFDLAVRRSKDTNDLLWMAIVGLADQEIHARIDKGSYINYVADLEPHVVSRNPDEGQTILTSDGTVVPVAEGGRIAFLNEYRFMLYRHWSLYESMYFSTYIASKLNVWTSVGRLKLEEFLAKMGFSLEQCKQKYQFMNNKLQQKLTDQIKKYGKDYGLDDVFYGSFQRFMGFRMPISAADVVYLVTSLLEYRHTSNNDSANNQSHMSTSANEEAIAAQEEKEEREAWMNSFNTAYDALCGHDKGAVQRGLELSMSLQRTLVQQTVSMMEKGQLLRTAHFRYAYIHATEADSQLIAQPCALARLAMLLVDVHRENGKWSGTNRRPLMLLAEKRYSYLVVGVSCPEKAGEASATSTRFGDCFRLAAEALHARTRLDGFDRGVIEVAKEHASLFVERVFEAMDA